MSLITIECPACKRPHEWENIHPDRRCYQCKYGTPATITVNVPAQYRLHDPVSISFSVWARNPRTTALMDRCMAAERHVTRLQVELVHETLVRAAFRHAAQRRLKKILHQAHTIRSYDRYIQHLVAQLLRALKRISNIRQECHSLDP